MFMESIQIFLPLTAAAVTASILICGGKKKEKAESEAATPNKSEKSAKDKPKAVDADRTTDGRSVTGTTGGEKNAKPGAAGGLPTGVKPDAPKPPAVGGMAGTHDPNYQTLAGVGGECFGADKKSAEPAGGKPDGPKPPAVGGMAGTHDPNYQTLAGVGGECFGADKKG